MELGKRPYIILTYLKTDYVGLFSFLLQIEGIYGKLFFKDILK